MAALVYPLLLSLLLAVRSGGEPRTSADTYGTDLKEEIDATQLSTSNIPDSGYQTADRTDTTGTTGRLSTTRPTGSRDTTQPSASTTTADTTRRADASSAASTTHAIQTRGASPPVTSKSPGRERTSTSGGRCRGGWPCMNGGSCTTWAGGLVCRCRRGFKGDWCEADEDECEDPGVCGGRGRCLNGLGSFLCVCTPPFVGPRCQGEEEGKAVVPLAAAVAAPVAVLAVVAAAAVLLLLRRRARRRRCRSDSCASGAVPEPADGLGGPFMNDVYGAQAEVRDRDASNRRPRESRRTKVLMSELYDSMYSRESYASLPDALGDLKERSELPDLMEEAEEEAPPGSSGNSRYSVGNVSITDRREVPALPPRPPHTAESSGSNSLSNTLD